MIEKKPEGSCSAVVLSAIFFLIGAFAIVLFSLSSMSNDFPRWVGIVGGMLFMLMGTMIGISDAYEHRKTFINAIRNRKGK